MVQLLIILVSLILPILLLLKFTKKSTPNLPPGPWRLPVIGNMHNLIGAVPHRALHHLALKYGTLMHLQLGEVSAVIVSSPDAATQVMKTHDLNFASRPPIMAAEILSYGCTSITFSPYGDYWRQLRKICTLELLSTKRVRSFRWTREQVFLDLVRWMASKEGSLVNLTELVDSSTYAVVTRAALGEKSKKQERLLVAMKESMTLAAGFDIAEVYPSIKLLQKMSGTRKKLLRLHREVDEILADIVRDHKMANATCKTDGGKSEELEDLVDVLLKFQDDGLELPLTTDNVKSVLLDVLAAGSETSSTALDWAMAEMLKNPRILEKAQKEVRQVFDKKGHVDESSIQELDYLKAVIKETLRLHPPLPLLLPRQCKQACEINDRYQIPTNAKIIINAWAINRDPKHWEDPDCFKPERFLNSSVEYKGNHFEYIPFGAGRRMCPGMSFGLANVELPLAMFLYHFDWHLADGLKPEEIDMTESFGITARREKDLLVVPVIKRSLP